MVLATLYAGQKKTDIKGMLYICGVYATTQRHKNHATREEGVLFAALESERKRLYSFAHIPTRGSIHGSNWSLLPQNNLWSWPVPTLLFWKITFCCQLIL
jgi:hypothetical protein